MSKDANKPSDDAGANTNSNNPFSMNDMFNEFERVKT